MKLRSLKLTFLLYLFLTPTAFSQQIRNINLLRHYNNWLKFARLDKIIIADSISPKLSANSKNDTSVTYTLILKPAANYTDEDQFVRAWLNVKEQWRRKGIDIYGMLFTKLSDYSFILPRHLVIKIGTGNEDIFFVLIKYDADIHVDENIILSRNRSAILKSAAPPGEINEHCFDVSSVWNLNKIRNRLDDFFKKYRHGFKAIQIDSMIYHNRSKMHLRISNIYGQITGKNYHEIIYLDISADRDEICYTVDAAYAAGIMSVPDPESGFYREVALDFPQQWLNYRDKLEVQLRSLLHGK